MISTKHVLTPLVSLLGLVAACSTSSSNGTPDAGPAGGPVAGAQDAHCAADGGISQSVSAASCHPGDAGAPPDDAGDSGGGAADAGGGIEYGDTEFNSEGDDDDCKYHVKWTATSIRQATDVTFTVTVTAKDAASSPMRPLPGEGSGGLFPVRLEVFLNDTHPAPNSTQSAQETSTQGTYTVGPIRFDASGQWTVRFHFHESCEDTLDDSPHGHAAFFVQVP